MYIYICIFFGMYVYIYICIIFEVFEIQAFFKREHYFLPLNLGRIRMGGLWEECVRIVGRLWEDYGLWTDCGRMVDGLWED